MAACASPAIQRAKLAQHCNRQNHLPAPKPDPVHSTMNDHQIEREKGKEEEDETNNGIGSIEDDDKNEFLIPGLPDDLSRQCLSQLPPSQLFSVCQPWRRFLYSSDFPSPHFSLYTLLADSNPHDSLSFYSFDPLSAKWDQLPPPPLPSRLILEHPSFISRLLPVQSLSSHPYLLLLSASNPSLAPALPCPLIFHPSPPRWQVGPPFPISPRRWCANGSFNGSVFLFSGVGSMSYDPALARSAFKWDLLNNTSDWKWDPLAPLKGGTFSREAVEAVASNGKLCMVNLRGRCPKEGLIYDVQMNRWEDMPSGMSSGWTGPAAADENGNVYLVDDVSGTLKVYQWETDTWQIVVEGDDGLKGATQIAAQGDKVCVVAGGGEAVVVVDVREKRMWILHPPRGKKVLNVHLLPRMSR